MNVDPSCVLYKRYRKSMCPSWMLRDSGTGLAKRAEPALLCSLGSGPSRTELRFPSSGPSLVEALLGSSVAEPSEFGQGSAHSARSAREDVAHKSTIPCGLKLFCALQICHDKYPPPVSLLQAA